MTKTEMKELLLDQDVWEQEVDEVLSIFLDEPSEEDLSIVTIFDSLFDLGKHYVDCNVGTLDPHIEAVLDYSELGNHLAEDLDEYVLIKKTGRIIEFEM